MAAETRLGGSLRGAYWSSSRSLDNREHLATSALWLEAGSRLAPGAWLHLDGWVGNEDLFHADATNGKFREGYVDLAFSEGLHIVPEPCVNGAATNPGRWW